MRLFFSYLKYRLKDLILLLVLFLVFLLVFSLYGIPIRAVFYPSGLCLAIVILYGIFDFTLVRQNHRDLESLKKAGAELISDFPKAESISEEDYRELVELLTTEYFAVQEKDAIKYEKMMDYYSTWVHQIKTPIAAMRLNLQGEDSPSSRQAKVELNRIEQYVEMVMTYLRLESDSTDYVIREYKLDDIVRIAIKRFSGEFIGRKIRLEYEPIGVRVLTDEKWLSFVLEQVLSNALKYTQDGCISIYMEEPKTLCIRDTGIGIAPEDLPRIFERGYTGFNGRTNRKASGIGLFLARRILNNLGHSISVESKVAKGTIIRIDLNTQRIEIE